MEPRKTSFLGGKCSTEGASRSTLRLLLTAGVLLCAPGSLRGQTPDSSGVIRVPAFELPQSSLFNEAEKRAEKAFFDHLRNLRPRVEASVAKCGPETALDLYPRAVQACRTAAMRATSFYREFRKRYPVIVKATVIGGVAVEIFEPVEGLTPRNERRVLINLHGGHFKEGWGWINQMESIPIASLGKFRVVSVDYRHAPEARFPAASEDVTKVYRALLAQYKPQSIGMFGCSAGGLLTAQAVAWFQKTDLPAVGAIGIFGAGASYYQEGDSVRQALAISGREIESPSKHPYFGPATTKDPFAFPILSPDILGKFPPSIIISSTRDLALSAAVHTHTRLTALGRSSELYVWEGMGHCFFNGSAFSQTDEAHRTVTHFFDQALAM